MATLETLRDGNVVLESRNNTKNIQIRIKKSSGKYKRFSAGTNNVREAREIAGELYDQMTARVRVGMSAFESDEKFSKLTDEYRTDLQADITSGTGKVIDKTYLTILNKWISPFFDGFQINDIDNDIINQFERHRKRELDREPSKSTINQHNVVLRETFRIADRRKFRTYGTFPILTVKGKGKPVGIRPHFEEHEIKPLINFLARWHGKGIRSTTRYKRQLLHSYVGILLFSGIRPGKEMALLKWRHIDQDYVNPADKVRAVRIEMPHRKANRDGSIPSVICHTWVNSYFNRLKDLTRQTGKRDLVFAMPDKGAAKGLGEMFSNALSECGLILDRRGDARTLYSLRHTYAHVQIVSRKVRWDALAANMGTSLQMLERHYSHFKSEMATAELTGQTPPKRDYEQELRDAVPEGVREAYENLERLNLTGGKTLKEARVTVDRIKRKREERWESYNSDE